MHLLDDNIQQQPDSNKDLEILRNRIFIMAAVCGLLWLNLRYFLLDEIILWSKPVVGANEEYSMAHLFVNMTYLTILLLVSFLFITFSIESTKKHFMENAIALVITAIISAAGAWVVLLIVCVLFTGAFYGMGFSEKISPDISFLIIAVGCFGWLYYYFRKKLGV